jgi:hypothetical protein
MGGREIELLIGGEAQQVDIAEDQAALLAAAPDVVRAGAMILPTLAPGCGPFPDGATAWVNRPAHCPASSIASRAAACLYAALVADQSLALIGTRERLLIEGRFADAELFARALAALRPDLTVLVAGAQADLAFGALRLVDPDLVPAGTLRRVAPLDTDLTDYRAAWQAVIASQ